ncbi:MAG: natural product biosynthesis luciferase-like monooxygenase protein [Paracoccaceae bacterium]|jgi:natural product biosynthesis luciferase-like monooxygenase protein
MTGFSCVVIGDESLLIGCSEILLERGHSLLAVVSKDAEILAWAGAKGIATLSDISAVSGGFDWLFSIANLTMIPDAVLAMPTQGAINFHDGPLPRYAGLNAPVWALRNRETRFGVTWHMLQSGVDQGDIVAQALFDVAEDETAFSLNSKCYAAALDSFTTVVDGVEAGAPARTAQDLSQRSYFARDARPAAAGRLDFSQSAEVLAAHIRALDFGDYWNPLTTAKIDVNGQVVLVGHGEVIAQNMAVPGTVTEVSEDLLVVATSAGALRMTGLTDGTGQPLDMTALAQTGTVLPTPDADTIAHLHGLIQCSLKGETHWRKALQIMQPVDVPLATAKGQSPDWQSYDVTLPEALTGQSRVAALMIWALRSSGQDAVDLAYCDTTITQTAHAGPGYISDWVPLHIAGANSYAQFETRLKRDLDTITQFGGFACDLISRDPQISRGDVPSIAINVGGSEPVAGTCITATLTKIQGATLIYDANRLNEQAIKLLGARLETVAAMLAQGVDDQPVSHWNTLPIDERHDLIETRNQTTCDYDQNLTLHRAFEDQVARTPGATALVFETIELSYTVLNARANAVAQQLRDMGVGPGQHVGLFVQRSPDLLIGALAILKAGAAYIPLDPAYPADRIAHYVSDSQATVIVTQPQLQAELPASSAQILVLNSDAASTVVANVDGGATADDLAYMIYTSGSTGTPKGVMVEHRNVANFFTGMDAHIDHVAGGVWLAVTSLSFDISVLEVFYTLARGFKIVLSGDENKAAVSNGPITISDRRIDFNLFYWGNDDGAGPKKYHLLLEGAKFADANGFNAVWTPERHFHAFGGPYPNPAVTGAAVAAVTQNISVRAGSCVAPLHHPARIAEDWAVIDNLTNGRAALGIASGWQPNDFVLRPENTPPENKPAMYKAIETLRKLWRGEAVEFPMQSGEMLPVITQPRPVSKELPIWVTTAGNPQTWREAGEIGANVLTHLLGQSIDEVGDKIKIYHAALRSAGHNPVDFTVTMMLHTYLADSREQAAEIAREPMKDYLRSAAGLIKQFAWAFPAFKKPKGVENAFDMDLGTLGEDELEAILDFAFLRYFEDSGLFGTVADGVARAEQLKRIGVDEIACLIDYGIATDVVMEGLKPLAEVLKLANAPTELDSDDFSVAAQIIRHKVTHMQCTPSMARLIAMNDEASMAIGRLTHLLIGGEALPTELVNTLGEKIHARITNMYGPTETTIWSTVYEMARDVDAIAAIGTPIANTSVYVLDQAGQPTPTGVPGELHIGGDGVTRGYWQRDEMNNDRFVSDPFADGIARMYRTGDLVRWTVDGNLQFLGRSDHQVKIRGQRIELGEIETRLTAMPGIDAAVVIAREKTPGDVRLLAYIIAPTQVSESDIRARLAETLPGTMIPAHIMTLDHFPLTPNKKIDRKALPDPAQRRLEKAATVAPATGIEAAIAAIWCRILGVSNIQASDNFFALGGHSLLAVQAHREIRRDLDLPKLSITDIFRFPTLAGLSAHLGADQAPAIPAPQNDTPARSETMSKRRAMRAGRQAKAG